MARIEEERGEATRRRNDGGGGIVKMARPIADDVTPSRRTTRAAEPRVDTFPCPRCGRHMAKIIGRSEVIPIVYLRCDGCRLLSVTGA